MEQNSELRTVLHIYGNVTHGRAGGETGHSSVHGIGAKALKKYRLSSHNMHKNQCHRGQDPLLSEVSPVLYNKLYGNLISNHMIFSPSI